MKQAIKTASVAALVLASFSGAAVESQPVAQQQILEQLAQDLIPGSTSGKPCPTWPNC